MSALTPTDKRETSGHHRILIVDDETAILFAYQKLIEREGLGVDICESFEEAMEQITKNAYFAVMADIRLAGTESTDGLKILHVIREHQPETKVILVTGYGNAEIEEQAYALGASHYFEKPVRPAVILDALKSLLKVD